MRPELALFLGLWLLGLRAGNRLVLPVASFNLGFGSAVRLFHLTSPLFKPPPKPIKLDKSLAAPFIQAQDDPSIRIDDLDGLEKENDDEGLSADPATTEKAYSLLTLEPLPQSDSDLVSLPEEPSEPAETTTSMPLSEEDGDQIRIRSFLVGKVIAPVSYAFLRIHLNCRKPAMDIYEARRVGVRLRERMEGVKDVKLRREVVEFLASFNSQLDGIEERYIYLKNLVCPDKEPIEMAPGRIPPSITGPHGNQTSGDNFFTIKERKERNPAALAAAAAFPLLTGVAALGLGIWNSVRLNAAIRDIHTVMGNVNLLKDNVEKNFGRVYDQIEALNSSIHLVHYRSYFGDIRQEGDLILFKLETQLQKLEDAYYTGLSGLIPAAMFPLNALVDATEDIRVEAAKRNMEMIDLANPLKSVFSQKVSVVSTVSSVEILISVPLKNKESPMLDLYSVTVDPILVKGKGVLRLGEDEMIVASDGHREHFLSLTPDKLDRCDKIEPYYNLCPQQVIALEPLDCPSALLKGDVELVKKFCPSETTTPELTFFPHLDQGKLGIWSPNSTTLNLTCPGQEDKDFLSLKGYTEVNITRGCSLRSQKEVVFFSRSFTVLFNSSDESVLHGLLRHFDLVPLDPLPHANEYEGVTFMTLETQTGLAWYIWLLIGLGGGVFILVGVFVFLMMREKRNANKTVQQFNLSPIKEKN